MKIFKGFLRFIMSYFSAVGMSYVVCELLNVKYDLHEILMGCLSGCVVYLLIGVAIGMTMFSKEE